MAKHQEARKPSKVNMLRPSMREKKRYLAYEIKSERPLGPDADRRLIRRINELLGVFIAAEAGVMRVKYAANSQRGLLRVERRFVDHVRACFVMIKALDGVKVAPRTLRVSGMLNKVAVELQKNIKDDIQNDVK